MPTNFFGDNSWHIIAHKCQSGSQVEKSFYFRRNSQLCKMVARTRAMPGLFIGRLNPSCDQGEAIFVLLNFISCGVKATMGGGGSPPILGPLAGRAAGVDLVLLCVCMPQSPT